MAESEKINFDDIVEVGSAIKNLDKMISRVKKLEVGFIEALKSHEQYLKSVSKKDITAENYEEINQKISESIAVRTSLAEAQKKETELLKQKKQLEQEEIKLRILSAKATKEQTKETEALNKKNKDANSVYAQTQKRLTEVRKEQRDLQVTQKLGNKLTAEQAKRLDELTKEASELNKALKETDETTGLYVRNVGNYTSSINDAVKSIGVFGDIQSKLGEVLDIAKSNFSTLSEQAIQYGKGISNANGLTGKFANGLKLLGTVGKASGTLLILTVLASAGSFFAKFSEGQEGLRVFTAQAKAVADVLINRLAKAFPAIITLFGDLFKRIKAFTIPFRTTLEALKLSVYSLLDLVGKDFSNEIKETQENIKALNDELKEVGDISLIDDIGNAKDAFKGTSDEIAEASRRAKELELRIIELEKITVGYTKSINAFRREEEDQNEIAGDLTKSFLTRKEALDKLFATQKKRLDVEKELAQQNLDIELERIAVSSSTTKEEITRLANLNQTKEGFNLEDLRRIAELQEVSNDAQDAIDDFKRQSLTREDELNLKFDINRLDAIKKRAEFEKKIDEDFIKDKDLSYVQRLQALEDFENSSSNAILNSLDVIRRESDSTGEALKKGAKLSELGIGLKEIDAIATEIDDNIIDGKIKELRISEKFEDQFRKIIELRREELIKVKDYQDLIDKDEMKRLADLENRDNQAGKRLEQIVRDDEIAGAKRDGDFKKANKLAIEDIEERKRLELASKEFTTNEKIEIEYKYQKELEKLEADELARKKKLEEDKKKFDDDARTKRLDDTSKEISKVEDILQAELDKRFEIRNEANQKEIESRGIAIDRQRELAEKGLTNQLAFEEQKKAEAELKARQEEQRQARIKEAIALSEAFFQAYIAELKQPNATGASARTKAFVDTFLAKAIGKGIAGAFYEGAENIDEKTAFKYKSTGKDDYVIGVHGGERVMTAEQNKMVGNMTNQELAKLAYNYTRGINSNYVVNSSFDMSPVVNEVKNLTKAIKSTGLDIRFDAHGYTERKKKNGNFITTRHKGL